VFWGAPGGRAPVLSLFIISSAGVGGNLLRVGYDRIFTC
jgi:hypothetical protein